MRRGCLSSSRQVSSIVSHCSYSHQLDTLLRFLPQYNFRLRVLHVRRLQRISLRMVNTVGLERIICGIFHVKDYQDLVMPGRTKTRFLCL